MGTAGYMSPEQVRATAVDHRSDIFSFGTVLYEMLSGRRAFHGDSAIETLNAILKEEPPELSGTNSNIAPALERVVWHCLEKSPERRFQSAGDVAFALESLTGVTSHPSQQPLIGVNSLPVPRKATRERLIWIGVTSIFFILAVAFAVAYFSRQPPTRPSVRLALATPDNTTLPRNIIVSPDGQRVAFVATNTEGKHLLWVRPLNSLTAQPLAGTDGAHTPFWSPDSRLIGYFANRKLFKTDTSGGRPQALCDVGAAARGIVTALSSSAGSKDSIEFRRRVARLNLLRKFLRKKKPIVGRPFSRMVDTLYSSVMPILPKLITFALVHSTHKIARHCLAPSHVWPLHLPDICYM